jgi:hypothetical protein
MGDAEAGEHKAIIYTVIESFRRRGIDPCDYLKDVRTGLLRMTNHQIAQGTPCARAEAHLHLQQQAAS